MKHRRDIIYQRAQWSLPAWGRGLKLHCSLCVSIMAMSLPAWGRGLKHRGDIVARLLGRRSPRGGVD